VPVETTDLAAYQDVAELMRKIADATLAMASQLRVLFVTNLRWEDLSDLGPDGVVNTSQYYTQREADGMIRSLQELGVTVQPFFSELDFITAVAQGTPRPDDKHEVVFTTAEGGRGSGRRALIPAVCNLLSLPFVNSGAHASSLARQKFHANAVLRQVGVRVPGTWQFGEGRWAGGLRPPAGSRVILKPTYETMCIGIGDDSVQVVDSEFASFVEDKHRRFAQPVIVQEFISGEEVGVPIARIGSTYARPPMAVRRANGAPFDQLPRTFDDEHVRGDMSITPFHGSSILLTVLRDAATTAFEAMEMRGVGRIDLRIDADGRAWVFDTSECPPPLPGGSYALAMESLGFSYREMLAVWLGICLLEFGLLSGV
jgi:D-alanine-D-alanine ligase